MNTLLRKLLIATLTAAAVPGICGQPPKAAAPAKPVPSHSSFIMPAGQNEGRDPFFPESTRPYEDNVVAKKTTNTVEMANAFVIKGSSLENGHAMVIINNHTFAVGDEEDVLTPNGRVHVRLVEIRGGTVVIEANGTRHELVINK